ncbi:CGNR zinc finger domain-containing protein [Glycomyces arizonensis]|uniref:CGNR zinc finger domain-containing protein n=1 Tax=Glycomyces arizonensis TaxID=256035 RepID=UPI000551C175|nr:CGNR zinc finger domain-containing protein [Glycomyces arizonensis]
MANVGNTRAEILARVPLALVNTFHTRRGKTCDDLTAPGQLADWLGSAATELATPLPESALRGVTEDDLRDARELRDAVRSIIAAFVDGRVPDGESRRRLNRRAAAAPGWPQLHWDRMPVREHHSDAPPLSAALAEVAGIAVDLFASEARESITACASPECIRYFAKVDPRRKWCSLECGNRARVTRHYRKHHR